MEMKKKLRFYFQLPRCRICGMIHVIDRKIRMHKHTESEYTKVIRKFAFEYFTG